LGLPRNSSEYLTPIIGTPLLVPDPRMTAVPEDTLDLFGPLQNLERDVSARNLGVLRNALQAACEATLVYVVKVGLLAASIGDN
jgi:hypothetical protein